MWEWSRKISVLFSCLAQVQRFYLINYSLWVPGKANAPFYFSFFNEQQGTTA
jgi:hypothetical protein